MTANVGAATPPSPSPKHTLHSTPQISSPTTPTHADLSKKGYSLDDVRGWNEAKVTEWLSQLNLSRHRGKFLEHNITGAILLDLDNDALKAMDIKTVGERVKILVAVRSLRQECYSALTTAARIKCGMLEGGRNGFGPDFRSLNQSNVSLATTFMPTAPYDASSFKHEGYNVTSPHPDKSSKSSETKSLLSRSNSFSRFLGRSDSKKSLRSGGNNAPDTPPMPPSPKKVQKRKSLEGGIMSMEKVKQTCVKVFGEEGQTRIVNVHNSTDAKAIMSKVLHKFGIDESSADRYCIFVGSSTTGEARALSDTELVEICRSTDRPEKERLILRKRHLYPTHEEFKRKGNQNARRQRQQLYGNSNFDLEGSTISNSTFVDCGRNGGLPDRQRTLDIITGSSSSISANNRPSGHAPVRRFFGERPPSEVISSNLPSFFPNHKREVLETAGINAKRLSMTRSASITRRESRYAFRNSVLPELVSSLGIDLGKFLEEEDDDDDNNAEGDESQTAVADLDDTASKYSTAEGSIKSGSCGSPDTAEMPPQQQLSRRSSSLPQVNNITESTDKVSLQSEKPAAESKAPSSPTDKTPVAWMKGSLIGRGTFGDVYLGMNPINGELMAVKQVELPVENSATEDRKRSMVEAMQREIALLKELQHENIVQYLGSQTDVAHFSIFLEYVPGGSVAGLLASYGAFQEPLVQSFVRQILKGLNYLHSKDIVHRDIKGANVLVDNKGGVKISDFGISKKIEEDIMQVAASSHRPSLQGSIFWMAPEVVKQTHYTRKADVWSLGCMVVEMFTGDHPFPEFSQMQAIFKIGSYTAPNIPEHISEDAKDFLRCTFKLNHEERPTAKELLEHPFSAQPAA